MQTTSVESIASRPIRPADAPPEADAVMPDTTEQSWPQFSPPASLSGQPPQLRVLRYFAGRSARQESKS